eukprot:TRINITY_DN46794_c0_g1_i1.p1 TRINITY_DN46794_c0_g1~~TRINITY_DN46794_c0_g1_i1.p1  ORF type:complete len:308 (-),score=69.90 TRINITY_DN46794_c0_g1_i1:228-1151(-)
MRHGLRLAALGCASLLPFCCLGSPFCSQELPSREFGGNVDVIFVQSELEQAAVTKWPGRILGAYHTALVFLGPSNQSWTIEFRAKDFVHALLPEFDDDNTMNWTDAGVGFCVTAGVLHGQAHWSVWKKIAQISADDFQALIRQFIAPWMQDSQWAYQLFGVVDKDGRRLLEDLTCAQGSLGIVDFLNKTRGVELIGFKEAAELPFTTVSLHVDAIERVPASGVNDVKKFFSDASFHDAHGVMKFIDLLRAFGDRKYMRVADGKEEVYYRLHMRAPFVTIHFGVRTDWKGSFPNGTEASMVVPEMLVV